MIDLRSRTRFQPDLASLARQEVAAARRRLGLSREEYVEVLSSVLGWRPSTEMVESWETAVVPPGDVVLAASVATQAAPRDASPAAGLDLLSQLVGERFADVEAVYATRAEFISSVPPHALFGGATDIRAAGLSLNVLCQQYADDSLHHLIEAGATVRCLFLDPAGEAIKAREREEGYRSGHLSSLNQINIHILLQRVRERLSAAAQPRLLVATYDETIRYNITIVDGEVAVVQPYLHSDRGVEAPTLMLRRQDTGSGLFPAFDRTFTWLWERSVQL